MASASSFTKYRSWSTVESEDPNDTGRIYTPPVETPQNKLKRAYRTWAFSLIILSLSVVFLIGLLVGYFLKDSQKDDCSFGQRRDGFGSKKLHSLHGNIMYFISNDNVRKISSDLKLIKDKQTEYVRKEFTTYGLDRVEVHEYEMVVTYPDPTRPNQLVVINSTGQVLSNVTLRQTPSAVDNILNSTKKGVTHIKSRVIEGKFVYGDYGRLVDLERKTGSLKGKILMINQGGNISIEDKLSIARSYEVGGVLLQHNKDMFPDLPDCRDVGEFPFPVQMISASTAQDLLIFYSSGNRNITIQLTSNYVEIKRLVRNVVGGITGDLERDRFIMIGASRSPLLPQTGTGYMLELARSFKDIQKINGWTPRRSIKFYSWDHDGVTDLGFQQYLKKQNPLFESSVVSYIDLDLVQNSTSMGTSSHWLQIIGNPVFSTVVNSVVKEVPDPDHGDLVLKDTWDGTVHSIKTKEDIGQLGVPVFKAVMNPTHNLSQKSDEEHHHMYSLAVSRVTALVTLRLLDDEVLPFNMTQFSSIIYNTVIQSLESIQKLLKSGDYLKLGQLSEKLQEFKEAGRMFTQYVNELLLSHDSIAIRRINDAVMKVERIILLPKQFRGHSISILHLRETLGPISSLQQSLSASPMINYYKDLQCYIQSVIHTLQEAIHCLQSI